MNQTVYRNDKSTECFIEYLESSGFRKIMVFHGKKTWPGLPLARYFSQKSFMPMSQLVFYQGGHGLSDLQTIQAAFKLYDEFKPDIIIACGGGSVIDTAKSVLALSGVSEFVSGLPDIASLLENRFVLKEKPVFCVIPTTAGSGSESTHFAVIYDRWNKYSIANAALRPDIVVLDCDNVITTDPFVYLPSFADAVCQAIESWWSLGSTPATKALALEALDRLLPAYASLEKDISDKEAWRRLQYGSYLAGTCINDTKTTAGHALSYALTIYFGIPHGIAVLLVMEKIVPLMVEKIGSALDVVELLEVLKNNDYSANDFMSFFAHFAQKIWARCGKTLFVKNKTTVISAKVLQKSVNLERLGNHPIKLSRNDINEIYSQILKDLFGK